MQQSPLQNINTGVQIGGRLYDAYSIADEWLRVSELGNIAESDTTFKDIYDESFSNATVNTIKTVAPYIVRRITPYMLAYDGLNVMSNYYEQQVGFRADMRKMALEGMKKATNNKEHANYSRMYDRYSDFKGSTKMYFTQGR